MNSPDGSITRLIPRLKEQDQVAVEELWRRYLARVEGLARPVLAGSSPGAGSPEDVAQSSFEAFFSAVSKGQAPDLTNREDLWRLLSTISLRKATDRVRREHRIRRGGRTKRKQYSLASVPSDDPTPSTLSMLQESLDRLLGSWTMLATIVSAGTRRHALGRK